MLATTIVAGLVALAIPATASTATTACPNADITPTAQNRADVAKAVLCLIQERRAARHLKPLHADKKLRKAAQAHADAMGERRFFSHNSLNGDGPCKRLRKAGYVPAQGGFGEALSYVIGTTTPVKLVDEMLSNNAHRVIVFSSSFRDIGLGVVAEPPLKGETRPGATLVADVARKKSKGGSAAC
jgi:uncharacterized protein YkwD